MLRSNDGLTVEVGRQLILRADPPAGRHLGPGAIVGRDRERMALNEALRASVVDGRSLVIGGDAGSGKSALLASLLSDARRSGVVVVEGACVEIEAQRPFGAFADVIASCERAFGTARVGQALKERGVSVRQFSVHGASDAVGTGRDRYELHGAILGLLADLTADGALAVFIEDLHWADAASLELFGYLTRRLRGRPVLLVATYRTDELDRRHPLRPALADLRKARLIDELPLPPLDTDGTGELIHARLSLRDPAPLAIHEFRDLVHARCEGNPLHTEETLDSLRRSGYLHYVDNAWTCDVAGIEEAIPASVADGVVARWSSMSPAAQQLLLVASVVGHRFDLELLADVSGTPADILPPLIHEAIDAQLVLEETTGQPLSFRHALTREALRRQLLQSERVVLHARIGGFLERRRGSTLVRAAELAYHLDECGEKARASRYYEAAARDAAATTDYGNASRSLERSIALADADDQGQAERQLALIGYLRLSGDDPRAARAAAAALGIGERLGDPRLQGRALIEMWIGENHNSDDVRGEDLVDRALRLLEPLGPTSELSRAYSLKCAAQARRGDGDGAVVSAQRCHETATALGLPGQLAHAVGVSAIGQYLRGDVPAAIATARQAVQIAEDAGLVHELWAQLLSLRVFEGVAGSAEVQRDLQLKQRALMKAHGLANQGWIIHELNFLFGEGDWDGFLKLLPEVAQPEQTDFDLARLEAAFLTLARNGPGERELLDEAGRKVQAHGHSGPTATWSAALLLFSGRAAEAVEFAETVRDEDVRRRHWGLIPASQTHVIGLFAARECGDVLARARFVASLLVDRPIPVAPNINRRCISIAQADIAEREGRTAAALDAYGEAIAEGERTRYVNPTVQIGNVLMRQRRIEIYARGDAPDKSAARAELDALLPFWRTAKATWYLAQLHAWAEELGLVFPDNETPSVIASPAPRQLTPRELEVARLVAQGLTNREISERLTLSVRTAESHVEQIRAKLGFRTRSQIAAWVTERYGAARPN